MAALGGLALVTQIVQFLWQRGDRGDKALADMIRAGDKARAAVGEVALAHAENAGVFTTASDHQNLAKEVNEVKNIVRSGDRKLNQLLILAAGGKLHIRRQDDEDPFS